MEKGFFKGNCRCNEMEGTSRYCPKYLIHASWRLRRGTESLRERGTHGSFLQREMAALTSEGDSAEGRVVKDKNKGTFL
jgi:hypothetical protein